MHSARSTPFALISARIVLMFCASSGNDRWQWESTYMPRRLMRRWGSNGLRRLGRGDRSAEDLFDLRLEVARFLVARKAHADTLGAPGRRVRRRDPRHLARDRIALRIVGQRQQQVDVFTKLVVARGRHEDAALAEHRHVGGVERAALAKDQLDDARPRRRGRRHAEATWSGAGGGCAHRPEFSDKPCPSRPPERGVFNAWRLRSTRLSSARSALHGCSTSTARRVSSRFQASKEATLAPAVKLARGK